ncbi:MAG: SH3 domain-containing protein [Mariprofundus sp.]|nr:SH3 domain-containing protein [Mariprofundus sp.]
MRLAIDILEIQQDGGYGITFNNKKLNGKITLIKQTESLTTIKISVKSMTREESIEDAVIKMVETTLKNQTQTAKFQLATYQDLRAQPSTTSQHLGWFRPGAMLDASKSDVDGWLTVALPSGESGYVQGEFGHHKSVSR